MLQRLDLSYLESENLFKYKFYKALRLESMRIFLENLKQVVCLKFCETLDLWVRIIGNLSYLDIIMLFNTTL